jgi:DNA topoisomerase-2
MYLFNDKGQIKKYSSPEHIMDEFYEIRCEYYIRRKRYLEEKLKRELEILEARIRFITDILDDKIILKGKDEEQLDVELTKMKYPRFTKGRLEYDPNEVNENPSYDYLTSMPIRSMTKKRIEELVKQRDEKSDQFDILKSQTIFNLWESDLDLLEATYLKHLKEHTEMLGTTDGVFKATKKPASKKAIVSL